MQKLFETGIDGIIWFFGTGWEIWSSLFAHLPYGDPYIAMLAAAPLLFAAYRVFNPPYATYNRYR